MYTYDPQGTKHRDAEDGKTLFAVGFICAVVFLFAGISATLSYLGR